MAIFFIDFCIKKYNEVIQIILIIQNGGMFYEKAQRQICLDCKVGERDNLLFQKKQEIFSILTLVIP